MTKVQSQIVSFAYEALLFTNNVVSFWYHLLNYHLQQLNFIN